MSPVATRKHGAVLLVALGLLLLQLGWAFSLPAFKSLDEGEHVLKAAAVVRGELAPSGQTNPDRRGQLVTVPRGLAAADHAACEKFLAAYTLHTDNEDAGTCEEAIGTGADVLRSTAAATYQPFYYVASGLPTLFLSGDAALVVMRLLAALACLGLVVHAFVVVQRWRLGPWPPALMLLAITPTVAQATATPSPNGLEMAAALSLWVCAGGVIEARDDPARQAWFVRQSIPAVALLGALRTLGPLWIVLIAGIALLVLGRRRARELSPRTRKDVRSWLCVAATASLANAVWIVAQGTNAPEQVFHDSDLTLGSMLAYTPILVVAWMVQHISNSAQPVASGLGHLQPTIVFLVGIAVIVPVVATAWRFLTRRERLAQALLVGAAVALGLAVTLVTFRSSGLVWQGRYTVVLMFGVFVLSGRALAHASFRGGGALASPVWPALVALGAALVNAVSLLSYSTASFEFELASDWALPPWAVLALCLAVAGCWAGALVMPHQASAYAASTDRDASTTTSSHGRPVVNSPVDSR